MRVLLDICVLSEVRHPKGADIVRQRLAEFSAKDIFTSTICIGEISKGIALLAEGKNKQALQTWLNGLEKGYQDRILGIDTETSRIWGELTANVQKQGKQIAASDGLIAAAALRHGLHVMTRNVSDFAPTGALLINPWEN